jgi:filamentous hemagglutinin family protein
MAVGPGLPAFALPHGGKIISGTGTISKIGHALNIRQNSNTLSINWNTYNIGPDQTVNYFQPGFNSVALNFIGGTSASQIFGHLNANGQVFLMNPYGIVFGKSAQVNVGGLVAAAMDLEKYGFGTQATFAGNGTVTNAGTIRALPGGSVALVGRNVTNTGTIETPSGTVALGAGSTVSLDFSGNDLVDLVVNQNTVQSTIDNRGILKSDGGQVLLKAGAQDSIVASVVNNTGIVEAQTLGIRNGKIVFLSGMENGTTNVSGILDASAPNGGNGGTIETSGSRVNVAKGAVITTKADHGQTGVWTMDPNSFYIGMNTGSANNTSGNVLNYEDISGSQLATELGSTNVVIDSANGAHGTLGNIYVNNAVTWSSANSLTLNAVHNVNLNQDITNAGTGNIVLRADDLDIGGVATNTLGGGVPSGVGTVNIAGGFSVGTAGSLLIYTNPTHYNTALVNPGTGTAYTNRGAGTVTGYDLLSSNADLYWIDQHQPANTTPNQIVGNNYALNTNITLPTVTSTAMSPTDVLQVSASTAANGKTYSSGASTNSNWVRFGGYFTGAPYTGSFDGLGHSVSGLTIYNTKGGALGFFGNLQGAGIKNVGITNASIETDSVSGLNNYYIGGLAGLLTGTSLTDMTTMANVFTTGNITTIAGAQKIFFGGGLVGYQYSGGATVTNSYSMANVSSLHSSSGPLGIGGLIGEIGPNGVYHPGELTVSQTYATGSVTGGTYSGWYAVGGFIGPVSSTSGVVLNQDYSVGKVIFSGTKGGFVGWRSGSGSITATNDFWNKTTSGESNAINSGGMTGVTRLSTAQFANHTKFTGFSFNSFSSGGFQSPAVTFPWFMGTITTGGSTISAPILTGDLGTITISVKGQHLVYNGSSYSGGNGYVATGPTMGASSTNLSGTVSYGGTSHGAANVGSYAITLGGLTLSPPTTQNEVGFVTYNSGYLSISPKTVTLSGTKTYDGTTGLTGPEMTIGTGIVGQTLTYTGATANSGDVGSGNYINAITLMNGTGLASNYQLPPLNAILAPVTINPALLTATANSAASVYGSSPGSLSGNVTGLVNGQSLASDGGSSNWTTFATSTSNVGSYGIIGSVSLGGPYPADYTVVQAGGNSTAFSVTPKRLALAGTIVNPVMTYNGGTSVTLTPSDSSATLNGFVSGQGANYTGSIGTFSSPKPGTGIPVSAPLGTGNFSLTGGALWSNYSFGGGTITGTGTINSENSGSGKVSISLPTSNTLVTSDPVTLSAPIQAIGMNMSNGSISGDPLMENSVGSGSSFGKSVESGTGDSTVGGIIGTGTPTLKSESLDGIRNLRVMTVHIPMKKNTQSGQTEH